MIYTCVAMGLRYFGGDYVTGGKFAMDTAAALHPRFGTLGARAVWTPKSAILIGMLSTSYMAHFNAPKFYTELKNNTVPRYLTVVWTSFAASILLYCLMGSIGFLTFGSASSGPYCMRNVLIVVVNLSRLVFHSLTNSLCLQA
jgi:hypothetical protein